MRVAAAARALVARAAVAGPAFVPDTVRLWMLDSALDIIVALAMFGELGAVIADVIGRTLFDAPLLWADEVGGLALTTMAFIGGAFRLFPAAVPS